jgi:hypothetical protein
LAGNHVELLQIAVERFRPDRRAKAEHGQPVRLASAEQDRYLAGGKELPNPLGERARAGCRLTELAVEVMQELADGLGVCEFRAAHGELRSAARPFVASRRL